MVVVAIAAVAYILQRLCAMLLIAVAIMVMVLVSVDYIITKHVAVSGQSATVSLCNKSIMDRFALLY